MAIADFVRKAEHTINRVGLRRKTAAGWHPEITGFRGYGSPDRIHVLGRALMTDPEESPVSDGRASTGVLGRQAQQVSEEAQRGWRQFFTVQVGNLPVTVRAGEKPCRPPPMTTVISMCSSPTMAWPRAGSR